MKRVRSLSAFLLLVSGGIIAYAQVPRPEYPQPQFRRDAWLSLNGAWDFEYDDSNAGLRENWAGGVPAKKFTRTITVPFAPETKLSGIGETGFHPVVWYRRAVTLPSSGFAGKRTLLHFGAVDYWARVWVNGQPACSHEGGNIGFRCDITDFLKPGNSPFVIVVRAEDPPEDRTIPRGKQYWEVKSRSIFYTRTTGIWQPVWLEAAGSSYLTKSRITTHADGQIDADLTIANPAPGLTVVAKVGEGDVDRGVQDPPLAMTQVRTGSDSVRLMTRLDKFTRWSVNNPKLYPMTFEIWKDSTLLDRVHSYTGIRTVGIEKGKFVLNGNPVYIKMVLDQGYWPESTLTAPTDAALKFDIEVMQKMGFNGARKHQKVEDPRWLYWCDKLGFLVSSEMANAYEYSEEYVRRFTHEWVEAVERDYSHPSIVLWVPINESWGVPNLRESRQQNHLRSLYFLTKSLDPHRPVIDNDGWEHVDTTDFFAVHNYAKDGSTLIQQYKDLKEPYSGGKPSLVPGYKYNGSPILLSEFGGIAYIAPGSDVPKESWGYAGVEKDKESALNRLRSLYGAIANIPAIVGICYTQLSDVEQEINGLLTYDRKLKFDPAEIKALNDLLRF
jgi:beta-galactosidase/beta-glucuronidase